MRTFVKPDKNKKPHKGLPKRKKNRRLIWNTYKL